MEFINLLLSAPLAPFSAALAAALVFLVVEVTLSAIAGSGFSDLLGAFVSPDALPDASFTNWLLLREMPLMMALMGFVCGFGLSGLAVQGVVNGVTDAYLPTSAACAFAVGGGLGCVRLLGSVLHKLKFTNTSALQPEEFLGRVATMTAIASPGEPGTAKFTDQHGYTHMVMVEPLEVGAAFNEGDTVVLDRRMSLSVYAARKA